MKPGDKVEFVFVSDGIESHNRKFGVAYYSKKHQDVGVLSGSNIYRPENVLVLRHLSDKDVFQEALKGNPQVEGLKISQYVAQLVLSNPVKDETESLP